MRDINSFTNFRPTKNKDFALNQVIRVLDEIGNGLARIFNDWFLGKIQNNEIGRTMLRGEFIKYMKLLMAMEAIENFVPEDVTIVAGQEKTDVVSDMYAQPVVAMEKLYQTVRVV